MKDWVQQVPRAQRGDRDAFGSIVLEFQGMAVGYAYSVLGDFQLAEDAAQEAFVQCYQNLSQLENPQAFPAWFRQIVFRQCIRLTRNRRVPTVSLEMADGVSAQEHDPAWAVERREERDVVNAAVSGLPEHEREVTALFYISGYSMNEVGAFLDVPLGTVKSRLHSARSKIREAMIDMVEETLKQHTPDEGFRKRLEEKLRWSQMWITDVGCIKGCLDYLGKEVSAPWLMGGTGHAFVINIAPSVCPSAPTAWNKDRFYELGRNVGFTTDTVFAHRSQPDFAARQKLAWDTIRRALDDGRPCYGWNLVDPIFYVIYGYDKQGYLFRDGHKPWQELGNTLIGLLQVWVLSALEPADDAKTVRDALEYAVELSEGGDDLVGPPSKLGLPGYDLWLRELEAGQADGFGMAYNATCWAQCRYFAVAFLREAAGRIGGHQKLWEDAIASYRIVFENLARVNALYPFNSALSAGFEYDMSEETRNVAVGYISEARQAEEAGLRVLRELAGRL